MFHVHVLIRTEVKEDSWAGLPETSALRATHSSPKTLASCPRIRSNIAEVPSAHYYASSTHR